MLLRLFTKKTNISENNENTPKTEAHSPENAGEKYIPTGKYNKTKEFWKIEYRLTELGTRSN